MGVVFQPPISQLECMQDYDLQYIDLNHGGAAFITGEIVGEDAAGNAVKLANGTTIVRPKINLLSTERNDVKESGKITAARGQARWKTRVYAPSQGWAAGDEVLVSTDGASSGLGKGNLFSSSKAAASGGLAAATYFSLGQVVTPPAQDGEWLVFDHYADPKAYVKAS